MGTWRTRPLAHLLLLLMLFSLASKAKAQTRAAIHEPEQLTVELYPENQTPKAHPVIITFDGIVYGTDRRFDVINSETLASDERFVISAVETFKTGAEQSALNLFAPAEREELKSSIFDPQLFQRNQAFFRQIKTSEFKAKVLYGNYVLFFVMHTGLSSKPFVKTYPLIKIEGQYFLTNALKSDPVFLYFSEKYSKLLLTSTNQVTQVKP